MNRDLSLWLKMSDEEKRVADEQAREAELKERNSKLVNPRDLKLSYSVQGTNAFISVQGFIDKTTILDKISQIRSEASVYGVGGELSHEQLSSEQEAQIKVLEELLGEE